MPDRARTLKQAPPPRGILRASRPDGLLDGRRIVPSENIAEYVHHFWSLRWALDSPFDAEALPHPSIQILHIEADARRRANLLGVHTGRLSRRLEGEGQTFGIAFRPAMFHPLLKASAATLTDRVVPLHRVLGSRVKEWTRAILAAHDVEEKVAIVESFLAPLLPPPPPQLTRLRDLVERMATDPSILRVGDVSAAIGLDTRALQRSFKAQVGVSPKWVIQRYRLHEAAAQLEAPNPPSLAALAASLGYADQAHFGRDFKRTIGQTPRSFGQARGARAAR